MTFVHVTLLVKMSTLNHLVNGCSHLVAYQVSTEPTSTLLLSPKSVLGQGLAMDNSPSHLPSSLQKGPLHEAGEETSSALEFTCPLVWAW